MHIKTLLLAVAFLVISIGIFTGQLQSARASKPSVTGGTVYIGNNILDVADEDVVGSGVGIYTVYTGSAHPNPLQTVFYGPTAGILGTTYNTIHVTDTKRDYTPISTVAPDTGYTLVGLDTCSPSTVSTATTVTNTWTTLENLGVTQLIQVLGTTTSDTIVGVTMTITNNDRVTHTVGVRYQWDLMLAGWDGAWIRPWTDPSTPTSFIGTETAWTPPSFAFWEEANFPTTPFSVYGSVSLPPGSVAPDNLVYAWWSAAYGKAYSYTPTGIAIGGSGPNVDGQYDSCMLYYWNPTSLSPGQTKTVSAYLTTFISAIPIPVSAVPEVPWGPIMASLSMLLALMGFVGFKRFRAGIRLR